MPTVRRARVAMACWFEAWLHDEADNGDAAHLAAVADAALDEVARAERLLSRFDPAAELFRVNRDASARPVRASPALRDVLRDCLGWWAATQGAFDPCAGGPAPFGAAVELDDRAGTVRLLDPDARIDLGGFAKGYALDRAARVLDDHGIASAFLHGGTSSALARGAGPGGEPWAVAIRDPFGVDPDAAVGRVELRDRALSSSAAFGPGSGRSDVIDPARGMPLGEQAAVTVVAATAAEAEVYSTALLAMGRAGSARFLQRARPPIRVGWAHRGGVDWIDARPGG